MMSQNGHKLSTRTGYKLVTVEQNCMFLQVRNIKNWKNFQAVQNTKNNDTHKFRCTVFPFLGALTIYLKSHRYVEIRHHTIFSIYSFIF